MLTVDQGMAAVNQIVGVMIRHGEIAVNRLHWTDTAASSSSFTNPSTPVVTLYRDDREVTAVCITWRRLERLDREDARQKTRHLIRQCYEISTGRRPAPTHRA
jgi:hypothetical protein